jgi:hypothetical protein
MTVASAWKIEVFGPVFHRIVYHHEVHKPIPENFEPRTIREAVNQRLTESTTCPARIIAIRRSWKRNLILFTTKGSDAGSIIREAEK